VVDEKLRENLKKPTFPSFEDGNRSSCNSYQSIHTFIDRAYRSLSLLVGQNHFSAAVREIVNAPWIDALKHSGSSILFRPEIDTRRTAPQFPERCIVFKNLWRVGIVRAIPEIGAAPV
jgi:hypothetical protein